MGNLFVELRRRNVFRFAGMYAVVAWLIIQVAGELEDALKLPDWFDGLTVTLLFLGFPVALVLAWFFDITPDGIKRSAPAVSQPRSGSALDIAIIAGLVIVAAIIVTDRFLTDRDTPTADLQQAKTGVEAATAAGTSNFVAVLPFDNRSLENSDAFLADGLHDSLLTQLSKMGSLKVISRTSVLRYRDTRLPVPEIARELGVAVVLEGSVQRAGDQVLINVQLIDGVSDTHLWAEDYQRELTTANLFDIQSEITHAIATSLEALLTGKDEARLNMLPTRSIRAYEAYVRGKMLAAWGTGLQGHLDGIASFEEAIRLDPDFAAARALRAGYMMSLYRTYNYGDETRDEAAAELERATALAPESIEILVEQAFYEQRVTQDFDAAIEIFERVLAQAPNYGDAWAGLAETSRSAGQLSASVDAFEKALELDPLNAGHAGQLFETYAFFGHFDAAERMLQRVMGINPGAGQNVFSVGLLRWLQGDCPGVLAALDVDDSAGMPYINVLRGDAVLACGSRAEIEDALARWPEDERAIDPFGILYDLFEAESLKYLGDADAAMRKLVEIRAKVDAHPEGPGWSPVSAYDPSTLPALLGDAAGVRAAAAQYESLGWKSVWDRRFRDASLLVAFARTGDLERATERLAWLIEQFGPSQCLQFAQDRRLAVLFDHEPFRSQMAGNPECIRLIENTMP